MVVGVPEFLPNGSHILPAGLEQVVDGKDQVNIIRLGDGIQGFDIGGISIEPTLDILILELTLACLNMLQKGTSGLIDPDNVIKEFWYECHCGRGAVGFYFCHCRCVD